jgi:hypothetical protein
MDDCDAAIIPMKREWWQSGDGVRAFHVLCRFAEHSGCGEYVITLRCSQTGEEVRGVLVVEGDPPMARMKFWPRSYSIVGAEDR